MPAVSSPATEDTTTTLYRAAIGTVRADYYLRVFAAMDASDRPTLRWNWAACLCTLNWFVFRKLWRPALYHCGVVVALALFIFGIGGLVFQFSDTVQVALAALFGVLLFVLPGLFGNRIYHAECRRRMTQALRASNDEGDAIDALLVQACTRRRLAFLALANVALLALLVGFGVLWIEWASATSTLAQPSATTPLVAASAPSEAARPPASVSSAAASAAVTSATENAGRSAQGQVQPDLVKVEVSQAEVLKSQPSQAEAPKTEAAKPPVAALAPATFAAADKPLVMAPRPQPAATPFIVNVGLFARKANADGAYAKLKAAGLPATSQTIATSKGPRTRVRVGPFATRQQAQAAQERILALSLDAVIFEQ
jgi:cell division septation protein DedD